MQAQEYFQSYEDYFWEWEATMHGTYLTIPKSNTISHVDGMLEILDYLSDESIPPFGSLLLAIIATNAKSEDSLDGLLYYVNRSVNTDTNHVPNPNATIEFLLKIQKLREYRSGNKRMLLFKTIFSDCHNRISSATAKSILEQYRKKGISIQKAAFFRANFVNDFKVLELLNTKFPTSESIVRAMNGLPIEELKEEIIEKVVEQEYVSDGPKDLITQLISDDKTFHVGSLIKQLWSGLNIPLHHTMPSRQPLGGVSDLSNKGDFDKLLLSEFAQDDDVFMLRIANNEALYIQREVPPEADKLERIILIDSSLKNWGNAKVLNFATALAIAKHPKTDIYCKLFVLGSTFSEVQYSSVDEVVDGLNILNATLDCSLGFQEFIAANKLDLVSNELFFITSQDSLKLEPMMKTISDYSDFLNYIITTNPDGTIQIDKIKNRAKKYVQKFVLPLEELWLKNRTKSKSSAAPKEMPLESTYPILFSLPQNPIAVFYLQDKYYFLASNKSLQESYVDKSNIKYNYSSGYIHHECYKGSTTLFENISIKSGGVYALGTNGDGEFELVYYFQNEAKLCYLNINTKAFSSSYFSVNNLKKNNCKLYYISGKFILKNAENKEFWNVAIDNGELSIDRISEDDFEDKIKEYTNVISSYYYPGNNILKSFNKICINRDDTIQFNIHQLDFTRKDYVWLFANRNSIPKIQAVRNKNKFVFPDGSEVHVDKKGMVTLISSDASIPEFYIPTSLSFFICLASKTEFAGNNYFYKEDNALNIISIDEFKNKYFNPFIKQIINHGV